jgi:hypothetical protein
MTKDKINNKLREFARTLSPKEYERQIITDVYSSIQDLLGQPNCLQVGSYPRFTAITPIHDLDVLYILGDWNKDWSTDSYTPEEAINDLLKNIENNFVKPNGSVIVSIKKQTHSVSVLFKFGEQDFSVDIVPAYSYGENEFNQPTYRVPEILKKTKHSARNEMYERKILEGKHTGWINSDPRGYISVATEVGENDDFRKSVKIVKHWKEQLKLVDNEMELKSFHLEQIITRYFQNNPQGTIFDAVFTFFVDFQNTVIVENQIFDRANPDKFIDDYIEKLSPEILQKLKEACDSVLINFENIDKLHSVRDIFDAHFHTRKSDTEEYLFDSWIPTLLESENDSFDINADITNKQGFFVRKLVRIGIIDSGRYLKFKNQNLNDCDFKWKVKNDDSCNEPRGEITDGRTLHFPESTKYAGKHYVECYAVRDGVCVAKSRHDVVIASEGRPKIRK